jgi:hypothetical protein
MGKDRKSIVWVAIALVGVGSGACSVIFGTDELQCTTDGDCAARGAEFANLRCSADNVCVSGPAQVDGGVDAAPKDSASDVTDAAADTLVDPFSCAMLPEPNPDPSTQLDISMRYTDFSTGQAPLDTVARLCAATDPTCQNPRTTLVGAGPGDAGSAEAGTGWITTTDAGTVTAKVELGFEGFLEAHAPQYPQTIRSISPALRNPKNEFDQFLLRPTEISILADQLTGMQNTYDSVGHGLVFVFARDCNNLPIEGASFTTDATDPKLLLFYIINSSPSITNTKTDSLGRAGYLNAPPGIFTFNGFIGEGSAKRRYGSGRVLVRAGANTTVVVMPSP